MKSLSVKIFTGENGVLFRIRNQGNGFDYQEVLRKFSHGESYSDNLLGGNGMRMLNQPGILVSYEEGGRTTNLLYLVR